MLRIIPFSLLLFSIFSSSAQNNADCSAAMDVCKKQVYHFDKTGGAGQNTTEADFVACFMNSENFGNAEENSTWVKFEIKKSGTLSFAITPHRLDDDIDFVVFKLPADGNCDNKQIVRCMAAGDATENAFTSACMGETGLRSGETDTSEDAGCADSLDNGWLAPLKVLAKEKYVILVSNVSSSGPGFSIRFSGTAKLPCDEEEKKTETTAKTPEPKKSQKPKAAPIAAKKEEKKPPVPPPATIEGRRVEVIKTIEVKKHQVKITVADSQVQDGDVISIFINDKKIIGKIAISIKKQEFLIELPPGNEHYLTVYAEDFGLAEPCSALILVDDGTTEQTINLVAGRDKQGSVKIVVK